MLSGGIFKNRIRNPSADVNKDEEQLDPTHSQDDASWSSGHNDDDPQVFDYSLRPAGRTIDKAWSVRPDKGLSKSIVKNTGPRMDELSDDEDEDLYTSDDQEDRVQPIEEIPKEPPATPRPTRSPKTPKKKKIKKVDASIPLESPGKLKKTKKKKKKATSAISTSTKTEESSREEKRSKSKKTKNVPVDAPLHEFQSFSEIDKLAEGSKLKSPRGKSKKSAKKPKSAAPAVTKMSIRSNFFKDKLYMSLKNLNNISSPITNDSMGLSSVSKQKKDFDTEHVPESKEVDVKKLKADAASKIRAFAVVRKRISEQKEFLTAFDEDECHDKKDDDKRQQTHENFETLVNELQNYETMLEVERAEMSKQTMTFQLKQKAVEQLLNEEAKKNEALELQIQQLEERLANTCEIKQVESLTAKNKCLQTQVELLQQKTDRQKETIESLMNAEQTQIKRKLSAGPLDRNRLVKNNSINSYLVSPSTLRRKYVPTVSEDTSVTGESVYEEEEEDEEEQSGYMSISSMSGKAQGELLMLRSTLNRQNTLMEEQTKELTQVKQQLADLLEDKGVHNLKKHVENLENEKLFFVAEIEKLKKGNPTRSESSSESSSSLFLPPPPPPPPETPSTPSTPGRWFAMTGRGAEAETQSKNDNESGADFSAVDDFWRSKADGLY